MIITLIILLMTLAVIVYSYQMPRIETNYYSSTSGAMECDYCACPVNCDGTPRKIDTGCPPQQFACPDQDCSPTANCPRK